MSHRIDVYASSDNETWAYANGVQIDSTNHKDERNHWLEVDVTGVPRHLLLVIYANGEYLFIDEITWEDRPQAQGSKQRQTISDHRLAVDDSLDRLKHAFAAETEVEHHRIAEWSLSFKDQSLVPWIEDPWGDLSSAPEAARIKANMNKPLQLRGAQDEIESGCVGILNRSAASAEITFTCMENLQLCQRYRSVLSNQ